MKLTEKLIIAILSITILIVSVFTYVQISEQRKILNNELQLRIALIQNHLEAQAQSDIRSLKYEVENDLSTFNFSHIDTVFTNLVNKKEIDAVVLFNHDRSHKIYAGDEISEDRFPHTRIDRITHLKQDHFIASTPIVLTFKWGELHILYSLESVKEEIQKAHEHQKNQIQSSIKTTLFTSAWLSVFLLLIGYVFARKLIHPILLLTKTVRNIAQNNFAIDESLNQIKSDDEIGLLSKSFIEMTHKLDASYKELNVSNHNLHLKTLELQELNNSLEERVAEKVNKIREQEKMMIAQSRLVAMGEMIRMIAHQWRQPLSTITLMIAHEKLRTMSTFQENPPSEDVLDKISEIALYLSTMIDDFQTFFKPDQATETISVSALIERTRQIIHTRLTMEHITLEIPPFNDESILTYANEVIQVFINIINNAIDALCEREQKNRTLTIDISGNEKSAIISIEDHAGGIAPEILPKIFDPYFSTKSKNGTGIGLYMAKMIIEKHIGGTLDASNTLDGAKFTIHLPKQPITVKQPEEN